MVLKVKPSTSRMSSGKSEALKDLCMEPKKRLNANIPSSLYRQLQIKASSEDVTINTLVTKWIEQYLDE
jgi:predicted HicB family RNase H-like nuclease|tara:strand:- start:77 stop:283 length:207 start_codon:yes stop_codon:yes gene_type:complete